MTAIITPIIQNNNSIGMKKLSNPLKMQVQRQIGINIYESINNNISPTKKTLFLKSLWSYLYLNNEYSFLETINKSTI